MYTLLINRANKIHVLWNNNKTYLHLHEAIGWKDEIFTLREYVIIDYCYVTSFTIFIVKCVCASKTTLVCEYP